jgi:hypothetical protein
MGMGGAVRCVTTQREASQPEERRYPCHMNKPSMGNEKKNMQGIGEEKKKGINRVRVSVTIMKYANEDAVDELIKKNANWKEKSKKECLEQKRRK